MNVTQMIQQLRKTLDEFEQQTVPSVSAEFRDDGLSMTTSRHGGRRHIAVEKMVQELAEQGYDVAEIPRFFVFDPNSWPDLMPADPEKAALVADAVNLNWSMWALISGYNARMFPAPFKVKRPIGDNFERFDVLEDHLVMFFNIEGATPGSMVQDWAIGTRQQIESTK